MDLTHLLFLLLSLVLVIEITDAGFYGPRRPARNQVQRNRRLQRQRKLYPPPRSRNRRYRPNSSSRNSQSSEYGNNKRKNNNKNKSPNIVFIMADDLGWNDVGFHNDFIKTPNINWLAQNGIELTDVHSQPLCSPSRAAILTGKYASNTGLQQAVLLGQSKACLPVEHKLWPEHMKEMGYTTKMVGKWHLGSCSERCLPTNRGFDEFKGVLENNAGYFNWSDAILGGPPVMNRLVNDQPSIEGIGTHLTIQHSKDIEGFIEDHANKNSPLFLYVAALAVHQPLEVTSDMFNRHPSLSADDPAQEGRRRFLGLVAALDDLVGRTIKSLKDNGLYDNSIIVFTSDNGGPSADLNFPAVFESFGNNYPLRGSKGSFYEGGTRAPTIWHKSNLPRRHRGTKRDFLMHITDWLPTFVDIARPNKRLSGIDGVSQKKNLLNVYREARKYSIRDEFLVQIVDYTSPQISSLCSDADAAFRWRDWKLIYGKVASSVVPDKQGLWLRPAERPNLPEITGDSCLRDDGQGNMVARCLFNLKNDPQETRNVFDQNPAIVAKLLAKINRFKDESVQSVFVLPVGVNDVTTRRLGDFIVPRFDFCEPSVDFPLVPQDLSCRENRSR